MSHCWVTPCLMRTHPHLHTGSSQIKATVIWTLCSWISEIFNLYWILNVEIKIPLSPLHLHLQVIRNLFHTENISNTWENNLDKYLKLILLSQSSSDVRIQTSTHRSVKSDQIISTLSGQVVSWTVRSITSSFNPSTNLVEGDKHWNSLLTMDGISNYSKETGFIQHDDVTDYPISPS